MNRCDSLSCGVSGSPGGGTGSAVKVDDGFGGAQPSGRREFLRLSSLHQQQQQQRWDFFGEGSPSVLITPAAVLCDTKRTKCVGEVFCKTAVELRKLRCGFLSYKILILTVCLVFLTSSDDVGIFCMFVGLERQQRAGCLVTTHRQQCPSLSEIEI